MKIKSAAKGLAVAGGVGFALWALYFWAAVRKGGL